MYRIKTLNKISSVGLSKLDQDRFQVGSDVEQEDGILVRSAHRPGGGRDQQQPHRPLFRARDRGLQHPRR